VQELLDVLQLNEAQDPDELSNEPVNEQLLLSLSVAAISGFIAPRTMCFWGQVGEQQVRILLDSGSSHTFISSVVAAQCSSLQ
jgi:hypothetical protein